MRCTQIWHPGAAEAWNNNYLCAPETTNYYFQWSHSGAIPVLDCIEWKDAEDAWKGSHLCLSGNRGKTIRFLIQIPN